MTSEADAVLARTRSLVEPAIDAAAARLDPGMGSVVRYHLGRADARGNPVTTSRGKGVRGALAVLSAQAAGGDAGPGVPAAVGCEMVHEFSLLHDDIIDADTTRRHRATTWTVFGVSQAILAGDALLALALETLAQAQCPAVPAALGALSAATRRLVAGQAADLRLEAAADVTMAQCRAMVADKTAALLGCAANLGAVLAGAPAGLTEPLAEFGHHLGMAFQIVDDILGIWGAPERTGKPVAADLVSRKKSLPVVAALAAGGPDSTRLAEIYRIPGELTSAQVTAAAAAVEAAGGRAWALAEADRETAVALKILADLSMPGQVRRDLVAVTEMLCGRDH